MHDMKLRDKEKMKEDKRRKADVEQAKEEKMKEEEKFEETQRKSRREKVYSTNVLKTRNGEEETKNEGGELNSLINQ